MRIFWGLLVIIISLIVMKYTFKLVQIFGHIPWAEQHLGGGGTYTLYRAVAIVMIILAFLYMANAMGFIIGPLSPLFGGSK